MNLVGAAMLVDGRLRLTSADFDQTGAAWLQSRQHVRSGFEARFEFQIQPDADFGGADGFTFTLQNNDGFAIQLPGPDVSCGSCLGYDGMPNSLAVEFDTYASDTDPNANHISVHTRGLAPNSYDEAASLGATVDIPQLQDGAVHIGLVTYVPRSPGYGRYRSGKLAVFIDDLRKPALTVAVDLQRTLRLTNGAAWVGFTAATGALTARHDILSFSYAER